MGGAGTCSGSLISKRAGVDVDWLRSKVYSGPRRLHPGHANRDCEITAAISGAAALRTGCARCAAALPRPCERRWRWRCSTSSSAARGPVSKASQRGHAREHARPVAALQPRLGHAPIFLPPSHLRDHRSAIRRIPDEVTIIREAARAAMITPGRGRKIHAPSRTSVASRGSGPSPSHSLQQQSCPPAPQNAGSQRAPLSMDRPDKSSCIP
jgi:hypothetical protein